MTSRQLYVSLWDLIAPLAKTVDMMNRAVADHHMSVAYLAFRISEELELPPPERREIAVAGLLHDIGAFSLNDRLDLLGFEETHATQHSVAGYLLLKRFRPFAGIANLVRYHHVPWKDGEGASQDGQPVPRGSHILHLADRVAVLLSTKEAALGQVAGIREKIERWKGTVFVPEFVDAMLRLAEKDYIWLEVTSGALEMILKKALRLQVEDLDLEELLEFARLLCQVIDFRSEFTATHSSGVGAVAVALARKVGFSKQECLMTQIAAYLHDLGKLAVPTEILEKPGKLTPDDWHVMRTHVYFTYQILDPIDALNMITSWGALHQERLDGSGYPFGLKGEDLPLGSRIMAVADVFTGITEDRPYRKAMTPEKAQAVLRDMAGRNQLDERLVNMLLEDFDEVNRARAEAQTEAIRDYEKFVAQLA